MEFPPDNAQRLFVSNVLAALVKLSYTDRYGQHQSLILDSSTYGITSLSCAIKDAYKTRMGKSWQA